MLKDKTEHLKELYDLCNNEEQRSLVKNCISPLQRKVLTH